MLIPAIDLKGGKVVQLVQGERLAIETTDLDYWIERFSRFPRVNVIDLDAAMSSGSNEGMVRDICARLPCQVGGGVRTPERALELCRLGARKVIVGSALFKDGAPDTVSANVFSKVVGEKRVVGAVDSKGGKVVTHGWKGGTEVTAIEALRQRRPRYIRMVGGAAYALLQVALHGGSFLGIQLRIWDVAAGVVLVRESGLEARLWATGPTLSVVAGSLADLIDLAPIVQEIGTE